MKKFPGLSAARLRLLAMGLMLLDHLWATVVPGNDWMHYLGRLAFPIFAFQTAEGYRRTHDLKGYCRRLLIFAAISEIPFDLMISGSPFYPLHQNVILTLLLGLLACRAMDRGRLWQLIPIFLGAVITSPDYGVLGVMNVLVFHVFRSSRPAQLLSMIAIHAFGFEGRTLPLLGLEVPVQAFAVAALLPIWLYSGEKGRGGRALQYTAYTFYPAHMLILGLLGRFL